MNSEVSLGSSNGTQWTSITGCITNLTSYLHKLNSKKKELLVLSSGHACKYLMWLKMKMICIIKITLSKSLRMFAFLHLTPLKGEKYFISSSLASSD